MSTQNVDLLKIEEAVYLLFGLEETINGIRDKIDEYPLVESLDIIATQCKKMLDFLSQKYGMKILESKYLEAD